MALTTETAGLLPRRTMREKDPRMILITFCLYGLLGIAGALVAAVIRNSIVARKLELTASVSLLIFPIVGLAAFLFPLVAVHVSHLPWYGRGAAYMGAFFAAQLLLGLALTKLHACPWHYEGKGSLGGLIRISDAPVWFVAGFAVEWLHPYVKAASVALG
jgi:hypothetical protein